MARRRPLWLADLFARFETWRRRDVRAEASRLRARYGAAAVEVLRERIAAAERYDERRRLYRLHDEIARLS